MQKKCYFYVVVNDFTKPYALISLFKENLADICLQDQSLQIKSSFLKNDCIYNSLSSLQKNGTAIKVEYVKHEHEIDFWLVINSAYFEPKKECETFLYENNLMKKWIAGDLKGLLHEDYYETSKDFGQRTKVVDYEIMFDTYEKIWSFSNLFYGVKNEIHGEFAKFYYNQNINLLSVTDVKENKTYII